MSDKPEIIVDKALLDELDALAEAAISEHDNPPAWHCPLTRLHIYQGAASPDVVRALVQEVRVAREALRYHLVGHSVSEKIGTPMSIASGIATFDDATSEARTALGLEADRG